MHGGMKVYAGAPAAARHYVEADRGRADDYYLAEGTGIARRFTTGPDGRAQELAPLSGDGYESWVAGLDPETGEPRGWLRTDDRAVRFVEVVVNGPKSWSMAAALHPDIAAAYDAAQDRAAGQVIGWLAGHATTRVGPRGGQLQVPVERLEAVTVAHHTSRAGDPHRHLHLQINARVFAAGKWRGLHTIGVRDSLAAINGIGHAAVATDPQFRDALAAHGFTLDGTGEILELAEYVGPFSARAAQIARNADRYEREWTPAHPGETPGPALRKAWDRRAWAEGRPDKVNPQPGANVTERWLAELADLGYRDRNVPVALTPTPVGMFDRDAAAETAVARAGATRSAWNPADLRGEVEQLIAAQGIVADGPVRIELAEDVTARAMGRCVPLLSRDGAAVAVAEHIRAWTCQPVLDVEADLTTRLAARAAAGGRDRHLTPPEVLSAAGGRLDAGQTAAVAALAGNRPLVVVEGAAGAGKTTTLAVTRRLLEGDGRRLVVVTPTLKAAKVASVEVGTTAGSAAWLAFQHGWRWDGDGAWTRLTLGQADPVTGGVYGGPGEGARLRPGDLLVVDEAGMLDQDTARALLTVADECRVRVALLGDRRQLAAVGRGGVLDLAADRVDPAAHLILDGVHRFTRTLMDPDGSMRTVPDSGYADLTLAMRTGEDSGKVFDALCARGQIRIHPDAAALNEALAATVAVAFDARQRPAVVVDTREQAAELNAAIRERLVTERRVDDVAAVTTRSGQRIGAGDRIATRRNDRAFGVANRDTWTVVSADATGEVVVTPADTAPATVTPGAGAGSRGRSRSVTPGPEQQRVLPADYVREHVELAYVTTAHGVQGDTVPTAHLVVGEQTGAASAYAGMTRGRQSNTAHLIAADLVEAREQWIAVFARDRADLGPAHAAQLAAAEAARYAQPRPLEHVLADLHEAWSVEERWRLRLAVEEPVRNRLRQLVELGWDPHERMQAATERHQEIWHEADRAERRLRAAEITVAGDSDRIRDQLLDAWNSQREPARQAAGVVLQGAGRFRHRRGTVTEAAAELTAWGDAWRPYLPTLPTDARALAEHANSFDDRPALWTAFDAAARQAAEQSHPEYAALQAVAAAARHAHQQAARAVDDARREQTAMVGRFGGIALTHDPAGQLAELERQAAADHAELAAAQARIAQLTAEPALLGQPPDRLTRERDTWQARRDTARQQQQRDRTAPPDASVYRRHRQEEHHVRSAGRPGHGIGR
jgi:exodeoxyribonuclease V alpha subunit